MFDLVIRGGTVIDGTGRAGFAADVAVQGDRIVEVGSSIGAARHEIDARGKAVCPGFIDSHTHDDLALLAEPDLTPKISQGVTTCVCGNCGISLGPLPAGALPDPLGLVALAGYPRFASAAAYLDALRDTPAAINSVPLLGHSSLRASVMDDTARAARADEIARMRQLADEALRAGYHGISIGTEYPAAEHASEDEIVELCGPLATRGGLLTAHIRDEADNVMPAIEEVARIGRRLGVPAVLSHHKVAGRDNFGRSTETLARIAELRQGQALELDAYPYAAASTALIKGLVASSLRTVITRSAREPGWAGRDLDELASSLGLDVDTVIERATPASAIYFCMDEADVDRILAFAPTMIGSDGGHFTKMPHPRLWGTFTRVLGHYVRTRRLLTLEQAVHKMTGLPAAVFALPDRGRIARGMAADITVLDPQRVQSMATFDVPQQPSAGIEAVVVNGQLAWFDGRVQQRAGRLLPPGQR